MYIIFNKDGSVSESQLTDYINQHSDGVNYIDISIVGKSVDEYTADGNFKLPNKEVVSLVGSFTNKIKTSTGVYEGYRITLSAVVTEYQGDVSLSIQVYNADKTTLFTYPVTLYVNETTGRGGDPITQDQYEALRAMMADYQLQYARSNMRSYDTLAEATEDLPNLSEGQMILAKETADSETSSVFQKVGDKLEGVSLDGLALDKFLRNKNAVGSGSFEWKVENQTYGYKNYFKIENGNQVTLGFDGSGMTPSFTIGKGIYSAIINSQGVSIDGSPIYWSKNVINPSGKPYYLYSTLLGAVNGVASLDSIGKIPTSQLPSYVSDVLEFPTFDKFPTKGEVNKIYIALDTNKTYRWGGTVYVEIGSSLALGETSETAYAGDKGKRNADNIATLQSEKLNRKSGISVTPETLVYACEAGGAESSYVDKYIQASVLSNGNSIPIRETNGAIYGRSSQVSDDPDIAHVMNYELITKAYGDKEYKSVATIELTDAQVTSLEDQKITFTQEQANAIMANGVSTAILSHNGTVMYKFHVSSVDMQGQVFYGLSANIGLGETNFMVLITTPDLTAENEVKLLQIPSSFLSGVEFNPTGTGEENDNVLRFSVDDGLSYSRFYFDTINGKAVIGEGNSNRKSYYAPETINNTATPKVLTSKSGAFEWNDLPTITFED